MNKTDDLDYYDDWKKDNFLLPRKRKLRKFYEKIVTFLNKTVFKKYRERKWNEFTRPKGVVNYHGMKKNE